MDSGAATIGWPSVESSVPPLATLGSGSLSSPSTSASSTSDKDVREVNEVILCDGES